jgi:hypothetical protein
MSGIWALLRAAAISASVGISRAGAGPVPARFSAPPGQEEVGARDAAEVDLPDLAHPRRALAIGIGEVVHAGVAQVAVVARGGSAEQRGLARIDGLLGLAAIDQELEEEVARDVLAGGPQEARALRTEGEELLRHRTHEVLGHRVARAEAEAREVLGTDVRDPGIRAPYQGLVGGLLIDALIGRGAHECEGHRSDEECVRHARRRVHR